MDPSYPDIFCNIPKAKEKHQDFSLDLHVILTLLSPHFGFNE